MNVHEIKPKEEQKQNEMLGYVDNMMRKISNTRTYEGKRFSSEFCLGYLTACADIEAYLIDKEKAENCQQH